MTGAIVPPPTPGHDEDVGWFLDYFSSGELKRYLAKGASQPVRDVRKVAAISISVTVALGRSTCCIASAHCAPIRAR